MLKSLKQEKFEKVQIIYQFLIMQDEESNLALLDDLDKKHSDFSDLMSMLPEITEKISKDLPARWKWERLNCMIKAVLLGCAYDLMKSNKNEHKKIIDCYIAVVRIFGEEDSLQFIHKNLQKIHQQLC